MTFLLVDDDLDDALIFQEVLKEVNDNIIFASASNGKKALNILRDGVIGSPDMIFLDLNMPLMNGKECLAELKKDPALKHIPVMIYTTSSQSKDVEETMIAGAVCFIIKPTIVNDLKGILTSITETIRFHPENMATQLSKKANPFMMFS